MSGTRFAVKNSVKPRPRLQIVSHWWNFHPLDKIVIMMDYINIVWLTINDKQVIYVTISRSRSKLKIILLSR
jgi:hypothetical protein